MAGGSGPCVFVGGVCVGGGRGGGSAAAVSFDGAVRVSQMHEG
jgi:hypothetical protein